MWGRAGLGKQGPFSNNLAPSELLSEMSMVPRSCLTPFCLIFCSRWAGPVTISTVQLKKQTQRRQGTCPKSHRWAESSGP